MTEYLVVGTAWFTTKRRRKSREYVADSRVAVLLVESHTRNIEGAPAVIDNG